MIPHRDLANLAHLYKGELMENALLNKEAHLAAKKHVLLKTKNALTNRQCQGQIAFQRTTSSCQTSKTWSSHWIG